MEEASGNYSIVLRQAPIPRIGGGVHYYWALLDPTGRVVRELHGEAYNRTKKRIATFLDILRGDNQLTFFEYQGASRWDARKLQDTKTFFSGTLQEVMDRWNSAKRLGAFLNTKNIDYRAFDTDLFSETYAPNSNAAAYSLGGAMGFELERLPSPPGEPFLLPGWLRDFQKEYPDAPRSPFQTKEQIERRVPKETRYRGQTQFAAHHGSVVAPALRGKVPEPASLTPAAARQAIEAAKADDAFGKRYVKGERDAVDYMHVLHRAAFPETDTIVGADVRPDRAPADADSLFANEREMTPARSALEAAKADIGFVKRYLDGDRNAFAQMQSLIQAAYPEPDVSSAGATTNGVSAPMFQPWSSQAATEGLAPWMQDALGTDATGPREADADGESTLAPWMRDAYPKWLRSRG